MEINQKKFSNKHKYTFQDDTFIYAYEDKSGAEDLELAYADFPQKSSLRIEQNDWLRNVGILWLLLGAFQLGTALYGELPLSGRGFWALLGTICIIWFYMSKVKYSIFKTDKGNIFIIQDSKEQQIVDEINSRRKKQLLEWYGEINLENELENEIRKFNWLVEEKVLTNVEAEQKITQVELAHKSEANFTSEYIN